MKLTVEVLCRLQRDISEGACWLRQPAAEFTHFTLKSSQVWAPQIADISLLCTQAGAYLLMLQLHMPSEVTAKGPVICLAPIQNKVKSWLPLVHDSC